MDNELNTLLNAMLEAGQAVLALQKNGFSIEKKANNDLVTKADLEVDAILRSRFTRAFPDYGWLSEESVDDLNRLQHQRVWVVDPIDGTKEFAHHIPEYAISVALIEHGEPILASVFNPATDELFYAAKGQGAWLNKKRIHCRPQATHPLLLLASRSEYKRGEWEAFEQQHDVKIVGSIAYKLGLVAAGLADATFSLGPKNEWDIAAGVLLVAEAGGVVTDRQGQPFVFNRERVLVDGIVATSASSHKDIFDLIQMS